jgi:hypothetical protein
MTAAASRTKCRQKYLTEEYYKLNQDFLKMLIDDQIENLKEHQATQNHQYAAASASSIFDDKLDLLKLHYTGGCAIEDLKPLYADVVQALGEWHVVEHEYSKWLANKFQNDIRLDLTPLNIEYVGNYQIALDVISLGVLLGEGDALRQIAQWMQSARDTDLLFEFLIESALSTVSETTEYYHRRPYEPLIDALYALDNPAEASAKIAKYLSIWYKSFKDVTWHNGHLYGVEGQYMPYYGYWSFESAAVAVIDDFDDSSFRDHIMYPKDLADWARANHSVDRLQDGI